MSTDLSRPRRDRVARPVRRKGAKCGHSCLDSRTRGWSVRSLIVLIAVTVASVAYRHRSSPGIGLAADRVPLLGPRAIAIMPGLYLLGGLEPGAAYAVETSRGLVLIDSGLDAMRASSSRNLPAWGSIGGKSMPSC